MIFWREEKREENIESRRLFYRLSHHLDTTDSEPDGQDESRLIDMHPIESDHEDTSGREEDRLADTRVDRREVDISAVVDFFDKKQSQR
jgi:hypothetical protein